MSGFAAAKLQDAVFAALASDTALSGAGVSVFDEPDHTADFPYISLGYSTHTPDDTKTTLGASTVYQVDVWAEGGSQQQAKEIMALVDAVLHFKNITVEGHSLTFNRLEFADVRREIDDTGTYYHAVMRYRANTTPE